MPARSGGGGSSNTVDVGPDSNTQSPGVYVARHCPTTVLTWSSHSARPRGFFRMRAPGLVRPADALRPCPGVVVSTFFPGRHGR